MDLDSAIGKHAEWKTKLRSAIAKQEQLDAAAIARDNNCDLGKWLHGDARSKFGKLASHGECVQKHAAFHVEAGKVATAINAGKYEHAEQMLGSATPYSKCSTDVAGAIMRLKKEASL